MKGLLSDEKPWETFVSVSGGDLEELSVELVLEAYTHWLDGNTTFAQEIMDHAKGEAGIE